MRCSSCDKEVFGGGGKIYTLSPEAAKMINEEPSSYWVCDECLANPLRCFADTLLEMWDIFPMTPAQKIGSILKMFKSGGVRLPRGVSLKDLKHELYRRAS